MLAVSFALVCHCTAWEFSSNHLSPCGVNISLHAMHGIARGKRVCAID
jgi:hypothetical protein